MEKVESLQEELTRLTTPGYREELLAKGMARGMIWRDGIIPPEGPQFGDNLSVNLLDHGFRILDAALRLQELQGETTELIERSLRIAGESIEAVARRGDPDDSARGFLLICAAAAFHIAHYSARSYCLLQDDIDSLNLSTPERILTHLMRRNLRALQRDCIEWRRDENNTDEQVATRLQSDEDEFNVSDALFTALADNYCRALASFEFGLLEGQQAIVQECYARLASGLMAAAESGHVPMWWLTRLTRHLLEDLWGESYHVRLPKVPAGDPSQWNVLRRRFIDLLSSRDLAHIEFWPSQLQAAGRAINSADDLVVALPTSAGKTRIAELCILRCLADGQRVVYVTPLRALSAQVEASLAATFRPLGFSTTAVYGASGLAVADVKTIGSGQIVVATPEKLDFAIRQDPDVIADVGLIVLDEGHMIGLGEREIRYEALVQRLLRRPDAENRRLVCLSAIFSPGDSFDAFTDWIRSGEPGLAIRSAWRPTRQRKAELVWHSSYGRLEYSVDGTDVFIPRFIEASPPQTTQRKNDFPQNRNELLVAATAQFARDGKAVLIYCPIRTSVETLAKQFLTSHRQRFFESRITTETEKVAIKDAVRVGTEWLGENHPAVKALKIGVAVHHGQLPRAFLTEIERLLKKRVLTVAISSPTLAQGVDLSFEVLLFSSLWRNQELIPPIEFANVIGRVGRAHVDIDGIYVLPIDESNANKRQQRLREFRELDRKAKGRQMESGILLLLRVLMNRLAAKLGVLAIDAAEYILNNQPVWATVIQGEDEHTQQIQILANELDNAILSIVSDLDCSDEDIVSRLDEALRDSYWQKRLLTRPEVEQTAQLNVLNSRATWLWTNTTVQKRRGFFAAGIGHAAGEVIAENDEQFGQLLLEAENAIQVGDAASAANAAITLAEVLLDVYPFSCERPDNWRDLVAAWLDGTPTSEYPESVEIGFIQDGIVYRLVWAVEAVRTTLSALETLPEGAEAGNLSLCLTYGSPNIPAALLQEAGLSSRLLAAHLVALLKLTFTTTDELAEWLETVAEGHVSPDLDGAEQEEWQRFVSTIRQRSTPAWKHATSDLSVKWLGDAPAAETLVRVQPDDLKKRFEILTPDLELLGTGTNATVSRFGRRIGVVNNEGNVKITRFGPA